MTRTIYLLAASGVAAVIPLPVSTLARSVEIANTSDVCALAQAVLAVAGAVLAGVLAIYLPKAVAASRARTGIQLTDQLHAIVLDAVRTAAGVIETRLDQGAMRVAHVDIANPQVRSEAAAAIGAVPVAAAALNMTVDGVARMIVGAVDTRAHGVAMVAMRAAATA